jgi:hypothetical protein
MENQRSLPTGPSATVRVGIAGLVTLEVPIERTLLAWLRRRLFPKAWFQLVAPAGAEVVVTVPEDDEGTLDVYLSLANFARRTVAVESVTVTSIAVADGDLHEATASLVSPGEIPGRGLGRIMFRINLGSASVRRLLRAIGEPQNRYSSPLAPVGMRGRLLLDRGRRHKMLDFHLESVTPLLDIRCPSSMPQRS